MKVAMFDRFPLVMVDWVDSHMTSGWHQLEDIESTVADGELRCRSIGYLFYEDAVRVSLIGHLADAGSVADAMTIPRRAIDAISVLEIGRPYTPEAAN